MKPIGRVALIVPALLVAFAAGTMAEDRPADDPPSKPAGDPAADAPRRKPPLAARVNVAIDKAAEWLVGAQQDDGGWQTSDTTHPIGRTALCTYALLHAGLDVDDSAVRKALDHLGLGARYGKPRMPISVYEAGCLLLLMHALGDEHRAHMHRVADWLVENQHATGLWGYPHGTPDVSNTQYAALGLEVASRHGHVAPKKTWKRMQRAVLAVQAECGAFRYHRDEMYRASMTHAALLCLRFASERQGRKRPDKEVRAAIARAEEWLDEHYSVTAFPDGRGRLHAHYYYYMYGLERYAVIHGKKRIAGHDWYAEGAEELLARRKENWSWDKKEDTAFAILFLRRAALTSPTVRRGGDGKSDEHEKPVERKRPKPDGDVPRVLSWLVAGPFRGAAKEDDLLFGDEIDVAKAQPRSGGRAGPGRWKVETANEGEHHVNLSDQDWSVSYCAVWVHSESEQDARLWLGSDDGALAYLNGELVLDAHAHGNSGGDTFTAPIRLRKGANVLIVKVENHTYGCSISARVSAPRGGPARDVRVSTTR